MWSFKTWINEDLDAKAEKVFSQRGRNAKLDHAMILQTLKIKHPGPLKQINQGSLATIYAHPLDPKKAIKVTADINDARNLIKCQRLNSPNVVKVYESGKVSPKAAALVVDFIQGHEMPYNTNAMLGLINGDNFEEARQAARGILRPDRTRSKILDQLGKNDDVERSKLSRLFQTLAQVEKLGIDMFDFTDNILDGGEDYVIIDMGM